MPILDNGKTYQKCLYLREDRTGLLLNLEIKRDLIRRMKGEECIEAWPFDPDLLIPLEINGKKYGDVYPISSRTGIYDPLGITGKRWEPLWEHVKAGAAEEQKAVSGKKYKSALEKATLPLSIAAGIMVVIITIAWAASRYSG